MWNSSRLCNRNPKPARTRRARPRLEALDAREVPSTLKVTNFSDSPAVKGSLRYELAHASSSGRDTIVFNVVGQFHLNSELLINRGVTIKGPGAGLVTLTTDFNPDDLYYGYLSPRALEVNSSQPVVISGITIFNNFQAGGPSPTSSIGGAVYNHTTLTMSGCDFTENGANYGGAIYNAGTMALTNCTSKDDRADAYGGGVYNAGTLTVTGCTFAFDGSYGFNYLGGAIYNAGTLSVGTSTFVMDDVYGPYTDLGGNTFITQQPQIGSFVASAGTVSAGGSLTLTATNITDANPNASITQVLIYGPNSFGGAPLGYATQTSPGVWTLTLTVGSWAPGAYTFYAVAADSYGVASPAAGVTVQVV